LTAEGGQAHGEGDEQGVKRIAGYALHSMIEALNDLREKRATGALRDTFAVQCSQAATGSCGVELQPKQINSKVVTTFDEFLNRGGWTIPSGPLVFVAGDIVGKIAAHLGKSKHCNAFSEAYAAVTASDVHSRLLKLVLTKHRSDDSDVFVKTIERAIRILVRKICNARVGEYLRVLNDKAEEQPALRTTLHTHNKKTKQ
jgi:hypothetical protein